MGADVLYTRTGLKFFLTKRLPVALLPEGHTVPLTDDVVAVLRACKYGATINHAMEFIEREFVGINARRIIDRLLNQGLLVRNRPSLEWKGNTFGASLLGEPEFRAARNTMIAKRLFRYQDIGLDEICTSRRSPCLEFEKVLASMMGSRYCLVVNSGTSALECAMGALGIGPGDRVIVPGFAYIGTVSAVLNVGAIPVICDIDESLMLSPRAVEQCLTTKTRAILCVHIRGGAADVTGLRELAHRNSVLLIEDCAQALGTTFDGQPVGSFGTAACFSFHQHKIITSGEGGAIVTNREDVYRRALILSDASRLFAHKDLLPGVPGHNYRMSEVHAAIGIEQLKRLPAIIEHLRNIYRIMARKLSSVPQLSLQKLPCPAGGTHQALYFMTKTVESAKRLVSALVGEGLPVTLLFQNGIINHDVYLYWPYVLTRIQAVEQWHPDADALLQICPATLELLARTIQLPLGVQVRPSDAELAADLIAQIAADG